MYGYATASYNQILDHLTFWPAHTAVKTATLKVTRNIFKKDIQRHLKENIHLKSCCNWMMFLCTIDWC